jgi:hypothetical protein
MSNTTVLFFREPGFLIFLFLLTSCMSPSDTGPSMDSPITTDQKLYSSITTDIIGQLRPIYEFEVISRYENSEDKQRFLIGCFPDEGAAFPIPILNPPGSEDETISAYKGVCKGETGVITVESGEVREDVLKARGPGKWKFGTNQHFGILEGMFQISYWEVSSDDCIDEQTGDIKEDCTLSRSKWPQSNEFEVTIAESDFPGEDVRIQTDKSSYSARSVETDQEDNPQYEFELTATVQNNASETVYLRRCNDLPPIYAISYLGTEEPEIEQSAYAPGPSQQEKCIHNSVVLQPGDVRTDQLLIHGPDTVPLGSDDHIGFLEGRFRVKYIAGLCLEQKKDGTTDIGCMLPLDNLPGSNEFEIILQE